MDLFAVSVVGGLVIGLVVGIVPLLIGVARNQARNGAVVLTVCAVAGAIGGFYLSGIAALLFTVLLLATPGQPKRMPCPWCKELILPGASVCRYCGGEIEWRES